MKTKADYIAYWTPARIRELQAHDDVRNLQANALANGIEEIVGICQEILDEKPKGRNRRVTEKILEPTSLAPPEIQSHISSKIRGLPLAKESPGAKERLNTQAHPITNIDDLWKCYITCALSSQENSSPTSRYSNFCGSNHPILRYESLCSRESVNKEWILSEFRQNLPRMAERKANLVYSAFVQFQSLGGPSLDLRCLSDAGPLGVFIKLAKGDVSDKQLDQSSAFSSSLDTTYLVGIGPKQIRNILVNSGLAVNVLPIDSRWINFLSLKSYYKDNLNLQNKHQYLNVENLIRNALVSAQSSRPDIPNLGVLDSIVFEGQG
jgi:hypothetical protein